MIDQEWVSFAYVIIIVAFLVNWIFVGEKLNMLGNIVHLVWAVFWMVILIKGDFKLYFWSVILYSFFYPYFSNRLAEQSAQWESNMEWHFMSFFEQSCMYLFFYGIIALLKAYT